jgi:hypothetical protein
MLDDLPGRVSVEQVRDRILIIYDVNKHSKNPLETAVNPKDSIVI